MCSIFCLQKEVFVDETQIANSLQGRSAKISTHINQLVRQNIVQKPESKCGCKMGTSSNQGSCV